MNKLKIVKVSIEMPLIVLTFVLFSVSIASASQWIKTYGGTGYEYASSIQQTTDGGYIAAGDTMSFGSIRHVWILKLDSSGTAQWQRTYSGDFEEYASSIQQTTDGGYIVAGQTRSFGLLLFDMWILKLDGNGYIEWQKTYGGSSHDYAYCIQQTSDGGYIVAGKTGSFGAGGSDAWILKLDGNGDVQWQKTYGGSGVDFAKSIQQTFDGGYIVTGRLEYGFSGDEVWVLKLDENGNVQWQKSGGGGNSEEGQSLQQTSDGGYIVAGKTGSFGAGGSDAWILKLDGNGYIEWQKTYGGSLDDCAYSIQQTFDGGYIVAGVTGSFGAFPWDSDAWVLKLDENGNIEWQKTYGGVKSLDPTVSRNDYGQCVQQTSDGGYVLVGYTDSFGAGNLDIWALKLDENGNINNCSIVKTSNAQVIDTNAIVLNTNTIEADTYVSSQTSTASVSNTNAVVREQCIYGCSLVPDATSIPRGGTLGLQGTVTNNTNNTGTTLFAAKITLPNRNKYPASGYLIGPLNIYLDPSQSKSGHRSHAIPLTAPLGTYTYHGYVGNYGAGIYDECTFNFEVIP